MTVENALQRANMLTEFGRHEEADPLIALALADEPDNEDGLLLLSHGQLARKRYAEAAATLEHLLTTRPDSLRGLLRMARTQCLLGRPTNGEPFARRAVELYPDNATCFATLADVLNQATAGCAEALTLVSEAIAIAPNYAYAHLLAGEIYFDVRQYAKAEQYTLHALRITPDDSAAILQLALARAGLGRFDESRDGVSTALRMSSLPGRIDYLIQHVEYSGIPAQFAEIYRMMLAARGLPDVSYPGAAGDNPKLIAAQGRLAARMYNGRHATDEGEQRAEELAAAVLAVDPGNQDARYVRSLALTNAERFDEALALAQQLRSERYPDVDQALFLAQFGRKDYVDALATIRHYLLREPQAPLGLRSEARCLIELERYEEALDPAQRAARLSPYASEVQLTLGLAAKSAGDPALAERALRTAIEQSPNEGTPVAELAVLFAETDRWPEAAAMVATLKPDVSDRSRLRLPCMRLVQVCLSGFAVAAEYLDSDVSPDAELLAELTHWLDMIHRLYVILARDRYQGSLGFHAILTKLLGALHEIPVDEDSNFAKVVRDLDMLRAAWRPE